MKKSLVVFLVIALMVLVVPVAFAAMNDQQKKEINQLYGQIVELQKQIVDKYQAAGEITADQAKELKQNLDNEKKYRDENGIVPGPGGDHCGSEVNSGSGMMGGSGTSGAGYSGMMGSYGISF